MKILFVCTGNICRSPLAKGLLEKLVGDASVADRFEIESAGTTGYHVGESPHPGVRNLAEQNGFSLDGMRARQVNPRELREADWIIAMTPSHVEQLVRMDPHVRHRVRLLLDFAEESEQGVHDPYYDGDFEKTYRQVEAGCRGFLDFLLKQPQGTA